MLALLVALTAAGAQAPPLPEAEQLATAFAQALAADDQSALNAIDSDGAADETSWRNAVALINRHDGLRLSATAEESRREGEHLLVDVLVDGTGVTAGGRKETRRLPRRWQLTAVHDGTRWRLTAAATAERRLAERLARATAAEIEAALASQPELDLPRFLRELADTSADALDEGAAALDWVFSTSRTRGDASMTSYVWQMRSYVAVSTQRQQQAVETAREALAVAEGAGDRDEVSTSRFSLGIALWFAGDMPAAISTLRSAADDLDTLRFPATALRSLYMAGLLQMNISDLRRSLETANDLERHLRRYPSVQGTMNVSFLLGQLHETLGNRQLAARELETALASAERLGDRQRSVIALANLAQGKLLAGDVHATRELLERAAAADVALEPPSRAFLHLLMGDVQAELADLAAAESSYARGLELARATEVPLIVQQALARQSALRLRQGRAEEALALAQTATADTSEPAAELTYLPFAPWIGYTSLGRALLALQRADEAEAAFRVAIEEVEATEPAQLGDPLTPPSSLADRGEPYRQLIGLLVERGRALEALAVTDRLRARSLRDQLGRGRIDVSASLSEAERQREGELDRRLAQLNRALLAAGDGATRDRLSAERAEARLALQRFRTELYLAHPELRQRRAEVETEPADAWRRAIPAGGLLLELVVAKDHTLAFLASRGADGDIEVEVRRLPGSAVLAPRIQKLEAALAGRDPGFAAPARELYDLVIAPLADRLAHTRALAVLPDGVLWRLPFAVLRDGEGRSLVERLAVFRAPSLAALVLAAERTERPAQPRLLAFGNPAVGSATASQVRALERGPSLGDLPDAEREVKALARLYGPSRTQLRVGAAAREKAFKEEAASFDVIHLATHGLLDDQAPLFSSLVLAADPRDGEDGLLEVREIADLHLDAHLVVLSACETGRGALHAGEGVIGMSWALMAAGATTAVVADWKADSAATAELMGELHRQLLAGAGPAEALRRAQQTLRRDARYAHPYYWAPFAVVGWGW